MVDTLFLALSELLSFQHLSYMFLGLFVGLLIGVLPALGGIAGLSLLIPFIYGMDQVSALAMLISSAVARWLTTPRNHGRVLGTRTGVVSISTCRATPSGARSVSGS